MNTRDFDAITALDLEPIKVKLMHRESGEGWPLDHVNAIEFEYRRFLYLMKRFPNEAAAPLQDIDTFWHYHILDTMKYAADCEAVFGYFLHHFPYIGLRGEDDLAAHARVGERMKELYEETFGEAYAKGLPAYSARVAGSAYSARVTAAAYSARVTGTAYSARVTGAAYSARVTAMAYSARIANAAPEQAADLFTERPRLQSA